MNNSSAPPQYVVGYPAAASTHEAPRRGSTTEHISHEAPRRGSTTEHRSCCDIIYIICLIAIFAIAIMVVLIFSALAIISPGQNHAPDFQVESVSASVEELKWVIGISIKNPNSISTIHYDEQIDVSLEVATTQESIGASIIPPFKQGPSKATMFNSTMIATNVLWPEYNANDLDRIFKVTIKLRTTYYRTAPLLFLHKPYPELIFACKGVQVLFSPNATNGVLYGNPPHCRL